MQAPLALGKILDYSALGSGVFDIAGFSQDLRKFDFYFV